MTFNAAATLHHRTEDRFHTVPPAKRTTQIALESKQ